MSINGLPVAQQQNRQPPPCHLQQEQKTVSGKLFNGIGRDMPLSKLQLDTTALTPPTWSFALQQFSAAQCHHLTRLSNLFPDVNPTTLRNLLELCQGDFIRTVDNILYTQTWEQKYRIPVPVPLPYPVLPTPVAGMSNSQSLPSNYHGNMWQTANNFGRLRALPNFQPLQKLNSGNPYQNFNILQQPQQILRVPTPLPSFQHLKAAMSPQLPSYLPQLRSKGSYATGLQDSNRQHPAGAHQSSERSREMSNTAEYNQTPDSNVTNLPAPPPLQCHALQEGQENNPIRFMKKGNVIRSKQCRKSLKVVQPDAVADTHRSCTSQKRPYPMIQDDTKDAAVAEVKKMKVLGELPKALTLSDASQGECSYVTDGNGLLPELLQPATICCPEHAVIDRCSITAKSCMAMKIHLLDPSNVNNEWMSLEDNALTSSVQSRSLETGNVLSTKTRADADRNTHKNLPG